MIATVLIILILVGYIALNIIEYKNRDKTIAIGVTVMLYVLVYVLYEVIV